RHAHTREPALRREPRRSRDLCRSRRDRRGRRSSRIGDPGPAGRARATPPGPRRVTAMHRPDPSEYGEYYRTYVSLVPDGDIRAILREQFPATRRLLETVPPDREEWAYDEGKWSFREVVGHLADAERVFADRALWIARDPGPPLPGMDQEIWAASSNARTRPLREL